jgi:predicted small lipoprotein YifL
MRLSQRLIAAAVLIALSGALAGCGGGGISSWDPSDMLDWLDTKKKLEGDRKPVFP